MTNNSNRNNDAFMSMSRRGFMASAAGGAFALTAGGIWAPKTARAEPKKGGHFRIGVGLGSTTDTLDPRDWTDAFMYTVGYAFRGNLVEVLADGTPVGELAESFESNDEGTKWVFKLRKGVTFSNSKPLTANDVIETMNLHKTTHNASGSAALLTTITTIEADGDSVVFNLSEPNFDFPYSVADVTLNVMSFTDGKPDLNAGAGPYLLKSFEPGVRVALERNPNAYKQGNFDSIEMLVITDANARQSALMAGQVDAINRVDLKTSKMLASRPNVVVGDTPSRQYFSFAGNAKNAPFDNVDVRLALKYALDRQTMVDKILYGHGTIGNDQPITPSYKYHDPNLAARSYDPDKARFHLKKAGHDSLTLTLSAADAAFPGAVDAGVLFGEQASASGIKINVERTPDDGYWANVWMKRPFFASYWSGRPSENAILEVAWSAASEANESFMSVPKVEDLMKAARSEKDDAKRGELYREIQAIISDEYSVVVPMFANYVHAASSKVVTSERVSGITEMDGARCLLRWSFA